MGDAREMSAKRGEMSCAGYDSDSNLPDQGW